MNEIIDDHVVISDARKLARAIQEVAQPLTGARSDYDPLFDLIGDAHLVLLGEASHGTHEFYSTRAQITKWLIEERGFNAVAVEGDWPDANRVHRYVTGADDDADSIEALAGFRRFPAWMWRNAEVMDFVGWLRAHNDDVRRAGGKVGFFGLDLYSLYTSIEAVIRFLDEVDPPAAQRARARYTCFDHFDRDAQIYGYHAALNLSKSCEDQALHQLIDLRRQALHHLHGGLDDEYFYAEQNARVARNAEEYYRALFGSRTSTWNLRDRHMAETLDELILYLGRKGGPAKIAVWEHNSHLGDARATEMTYRGELNLGQLARERYGKDVVSIGFSTHRGTVTAASDWGGPAERKQVRPALPQSYEAVFHTTGLARFLLTLHGANDAIAQLHVPRLQRAIGVIYRPETERQSHYFYADLPRQFDAILHFDETRAVEPLERTAEWGRGELPETYPFAL